MAWRALAAASLSHTDHSTCREPDNVSSACMQHMCHGMQVHAECQLLCSVAHSQTSKPAACQRRALTLLYPGVHELGPAAANRSQHCICFWVLFPQAADLQHGSACVISAACSWLAAHGLDKRAWRRSV
jgi:hypothetical protein